MEFRADGFDVWVFRRTGTGVEYLLLHTSKAKAERWFGGGRFWQVPSHFFEDASPVDAISRELARFGLKADGVWAVEHAYTIYNRRYDNIMHIAVFAAEVIADEIRLGEEHSEYAWVSAEEAERRVNYRGLKEGLHWVRYDVTECPHPLRELRLK
jgi:hypothetical protein